MRTISMVVLAIIAVLYAAPAVGQPAGRNELSVFGGVSLLDADATDPGDPRILALPARPLIYPPPFQFSRSIGASGEFGVRYGRDVTDSVTFIGDFSIAPAHSATERFGRGCPELCISFPALELYAPGLFSERFVAYHYGGGMRLNVWRGPLVTPAVVAGIGGVTYSGENRSDTQFTLRLGGSVTAAVKNLTTGIEVVDVMVPDHFLTDQLEHDLHVRMSLGVRF